MTDHRVFVYGTLKQGFPLNDYLQNAEYEGRDFLLGKMFTLGPFPVVIPAEKGRRIVGEVYKITTPILKLLDAVEGYPSMYKRDIFKLTSGKEAFVYYMDKAPKGAMEVRGGEWT